MQCLSATTGAEVIKKLWKSCKSERCCKLCAQPAIYKLLYILTVPLSFFFNFARPTEEMY